MALLIPLVGMIGAEVPQTVVQTTVNVEELPKIEMPETYDLIYDEAVPISVGFKMSIGDRMAVRFTPPAYPFTITEACYVPIGWSDDPDNWDANCKLVFFNPGLGDGPGNLIDEMTVSATEQGNLNWFDVSSLNMVISSGDFWYGVENVVDDNPGMALDGMAPHNHRSWMYTTFQGETEQKWAAFDNINVGWDVPLGDSADLILRIRGESSGSTGIGEVELTPSSVEITPAATIVVQGTSLSYTLADAGDVAISLWDAMGREVKTLYAGHVEAGSHQLSWDASDLARGTYFVRLDAPGAMKLARVVVVD